MNETRGIEGLVELRKSYEYTLEKVGADAAAGPLWQEYINFLAGPRTGTPAYQALFGGGLPGQEEGQRVLWLRFISALHHTPLPSHALCSNQDSLARPPHDLEHHNLALLALFHGLTFSWCQIPSIFHGLTSPTEVHAWQKRI